MKVVRDFLPPPKDLVLRAQAVKVTIALSKRTVEFFKAEAQKREIQYQPMIRRLLDAYAEHHTRRPTTPATQTRRAVPRRPVRAMPHARGTKSTRLSE